MQQATELYQQAIQPALQAAPLTRIRRSARRLPTRRRAASSGDAPAFAYASGLVWTNLLRGSYQATLSALQAGDSATASDWLRLREYRQATKFSLVDDPAAQAIARLQAGFQTGSGNLDEVMTTVSNDLRDSYTFRLRDALSKLKDAAAQDFTIRSADWAARVSGYFGILQADFSAKRGAGRNRRALQAQLSDLQTAALSGRSGGGQHAGRPDQDGARQLRTGRADRRRNRQTRAAALPVHRSGSRRIRARRAGWAGHHPD